MTFWATDPFLFLTGSVNASPFWTIPLVHLVPFPMPLCSFEANPLTLIVNAIQPSDSHVPDCCQHHSAGGDHLMAQGYRLPQFLRCPVHVLFKAHWSELPLRAIAGLTKTMAAFSIMWSNSPSGNWIAFYRSSSVTVNYPTKTFMWVNQRTKENKLIC